MSKQVQTPVTLQKKNKLDSKKSIKGGDFMTKPAEAQAIYDVLMESVPELLKIESFRQGERLIKAIIKGLEEVERREMQYIF